MIIEYPAEIITAFKAELERIGDENFNNDEYVKQYIFNLTIEWVSYR